jgi:hypothetical protein
MQFCLNLNLRSSSCIFDRNTYPKIGAGECMADIQSGEYSSADLHLWVASGALLLALESEGYDFQAANFAGPADRAAGR